VGHAKYPGKVLLAVPEDSAMSQYTVIDPILEPLDTLLSSLVVSANPYRGAYSIARDTVARLRMLLNQRTYFLKGDGAYLPNALTIFFGFEDIASSLAMVGPVGRRVRLYNGRPNYFSQTYVQRDGSLNVTLGPTGTADIRDFSSGMPPAGQLTHLPDWDSPVTVGMPGGLTSFNDVLSAYNFLEPGES
jgi:hypothetical protein